MRIFILVVALFLGVISTSSFAGDYYRSTKPSGVDEIYTDPMRMYTTESKVKTEFTGFTASQMGFIFLIPMATLFVFWGFQLGTGILLHRPMHTLKTMSPRQYAWMEQARKTQTEEWRERWNDPVQRHDMRLTGLIYFLVGLGMMACIVVYGDEEDETNTIAVPSIGNQIIQWAPGTYFAGAQWKASLDGSLVDLNTHETQGVWKMQRRRLVLTLNNPATQKLNKYSQKRLPELRELMFQPRENSVYLHAFDATTGSMSNYAAYEVGRIKIVWPNNHID